MKATPTLDLPSCWPSLPFDSWRDTCATLHMWTQIVGKIRLAQTPLINHWWNVPLYVTSRGLTTSSIPYGERSFELSFDFIGHQLVLETNDGGVDVLKLEPQSVADFYQKCMAMLRCADIDVQIWPVPVEIPDPTPFDQDRKHCSYDADAANKISRGASWSPSLPFFSVSVLDPSGNAVQYISSGEASIWPSPASQDEERRGAPMLTQ